MADAPPNDDFNARSNNFLTWLGQNGTTVSSKIQLADLRHRSAGRGVVATEDIEEDEVLFTVPRSSILTVGSSSLPSNIREGLDDQWLSLILAMAYEHQLGDSSMWKPYFDVLPTEFDTLMYWSEDELKWLQGSAVVEKIGRKSADEAFTEQLIPIVRQHQDTFKAENMSDENLLELFHRMGTIIMAYAFDLEDPNQQQQNEEDGWEEDSDAGGILPKGMVPLADMLNADADRNNSKLFYEEDKVVMKTICPVKAGEELFNDYGPLPRADVLRRYGYVTENYAKYDVVEISLDLAKDVALKRKVITEADIEMRTSYLEEQGVLDDAYDVGRRGGEEGEQFSDEFCILLNTLALNHAEFEKLGEKDKLPKPELSEKAKVSLDVVLHARRQQYPKYMGNMNGQIISADQAAPRNEQRKAMAQQVIAGELSVIEEAIQTLNVSQTNGHEKRTAGEDSAPGVKRQKTK